MPLFICISGSPCSLTLWQIAFDEAPCDYTGSSCLLTAFTPCNLTVSLLLRYVMHWMTVSSLGKCCEGKCRQKLTTCEPPAVDEQLCRCAADMC